MVAISRFHEGILGLVLIGELSPGRIKYRVATTHWPWRGQAELRQISQRPNGSTCLQPGFKVSAPEVDQCANELVQQGVKLPWPPTDHVFGDEPHPIFAGGSQSRCSPTMSGPGKIVSWSHRERADLSHPSFPTILLGGVGCLASSLSHLQPV
jgi:hypothetical protein